MGPCVEAYPSQRRPRRSEDRERVLYIFPPPKIIKICPPAQVAHASFFLGEVIQKLILNSFGPLREEKILVTFDVPELFVCVDEENERYLLLKLNGEERYLCVKISIPVLLSMLKGKASMEETFRKAADGIAYYVQFDFDSLTYHFEQKHIQEVPAKDLPKVGALFMLRNKGGEKYVANLENEQTKHE